jgi:hypothetical protein
MTNSSPPLTIEQFFRAMQVGATAESEMMSLFDEDAEYCEPFSDKTQTHKGKIAIRQAFLLGWQNPLPEMQLEVDRFDIDDQTVTVDWTCHSPALPNGKGRGTNVFLLKNGLIKRLVTTFR